MKSKRLCAVADCKEVVGKGGCLCDFHHAYYDRDSWNEPIGHKETGTERRKKGLKPNGHVPSFPIMCSDGRIWLSKKICQDDTHISVYTLSQLCMSDDMYKGEWYRYLYDYKDVCHTDWYVGDDGTIIKGSIELFDLLGIKGYQLTEKIINNERVEGVRYHLASDKEKVSIIRDEMQSQGKDFFSVEDESYTGIC